MKKNLKVMIIVILALFLSACTLEETTTYEYNDIPGTKLSLTYYHKGDLVNKQTSLNTISYKEAGYENKEEAEKAMNEAGAAQFQNIKGVEHSLEYSETKLKEKLSIDFTQVDFDEVADFPGFTFSYKPEAGVSVKKSGEYLESVGFTKK